MDDKSKDPPGGATGGGKISGSGAEGLEGPVPPPLAREDQIVLLRDNFPLLKTESIPPDLRRFVQDKAEGNPFYLEELVNSLIESETLIRDNGSWRITRPTTESDIPSTIHGLISGRLDRLEKETKRILQEASVIGRGFLYKILKRITELEDRVDRGLSTLERLDLIHAGANSFPLGEGIRAISFQRILEDLQPL